MVQPSLNPPKLGSLVVGVTSPEITEKHNPNFEFAPVFGLITVHDIRELYDYSNVEEKPFQFSAASFCISILPLLFVGFCAICGHYRGGPVLSVL